MVALFSSAERDDWRREAEALRLEGSDDRKKALQRRDISQIQPSEKESPNCSSGKFIGVAFVWLLLAYGRQKGRKLSPSEGPLKRLGSILRAIVPGGKRADNGQNRSSNQDWKKKKPSLMAAEAAQARHGGGHKKKKKKKRSH